MTTESPGPDVSKLLSMADNVVIRNRVYKRARHSELGAREYGRLDKSISELAETAEKYRKSERGGR